MMIQSLEAMADEADYYEALRRRDERDQRVINSIHGHEVTDEEQAIIDGYEPRVEYEEGPLIKPYRKVERINGISI